jgi:hypothetical protein
MDLAMYMISRETAEMQHFPHWAASHAIFSESIPDAGFIRNSRYLILTTSF